MATCLECSSELPNHRPGCDAEAVAAVREMVLSGTPPLALLTYRQPAPTGNGPEVLPVVLEFLTRRQEQGRLKYGTTLRAHNGRDALRDLVEEQADGLMYGVQLQMQWPALVAQVRHDALEEALQVVELALMPEEQAAAPDSELVRVAGYVNGALRRVQDGLRGLQGKPPAEPEPVRHGPRKGEPRKRAKGHRWALASHVGDPQRWECQDCPLQRHARKGARGGPTYAFLLDGVVLAAGAVNVVKVPPCPPPKGGA